MTFAQFVNEKVVGFVDESVIPLLFILAFLFFLIGMVRFFFSQDQENRAKGKQFVLWGIIGLVVMFSLWGIVNMFVNILQ
jgi:hypothetical protein